MMPSCNRGDSKKDSSGFSIELDPFDRFYHINKIYFMGFHNVIASEGLHQQAWDEGQVVS